jgi:hypothetical protein
MNVYVNGVLLDASKDYGTTATTVVFADPPQAGDRLDFAADSIGFTYTKTAPGNTAVIDIDQIWLQTIEHHSIINRAWNHRDHPMIADAFERLRTALTLLED